MKNIYERPRVLVEEFTPNAYCGSCTGENTTVTATFDCLLGDKKDESTVISTAGNDYGLSTCTNAVGILKDYTTVLAASKNHTTSGSFKWNDMRGTAAGASGLVYICADKDFKNFSHEWSNDHWHLSSGALTHAGTHDEHAMVAAYYGDVANMAIS